MDCGGQSPSPSRGSLCCWITPSEALGRLDRRRRPAAPACPAAFLETIFPAREIDRKRASHSLSEPDGVGTRRIVPRFPCESGRPILGSNCYDQRGSNRSFIKHDHRLAQAAQRIKCPARAGATSTGSSPTIAHLYSGGRQGRIPTAIEYALNLFVIRVSHPRLVRGCFRSIRRGALNRTPEQSFSRLKSRPNLPHH